MNSVLAQSKIQRALKGVARSCTSLMAVSSAVFLLTCAVGCGSEKVPPSQANTMGPVAALTPQPTLAALPADGCRTEKLVAGVAALQGQVETGVNLSFTAVTDDDLGRLEFPETVREIDLSNTAVTDRGVEYLVRVPYLETLALRDTQVTDRVVEILRRMPSLCEVRLDNTNVSPVAQLEMVSFLSSRSSARAKRYREAATAARRQP